MAESSFLRIKCVACREPPRPDEYGWSAMVGQTFNDLRLGKVTLIIERDENFGTYGIKWFDVFCTNDAGKQHLVASFNAAQVEVVTYFTPGEEY